MSSMDVDPEEMRSMQYAEENPGYQREISVRPPTDEDMLDPDWMDTWAALQDQTDGENRLIRKSNERTQVAALRAERDMLREQLKEHGIKPNEYEG